MMCSFGVSFWDTSDHHNHAVAKWYPPKIDLVAPPVPPVFTDPVDAAAKVPPLSRASVRRWQCSLCKQYSSIRRDNRCEQAVNSLQHGVYGMGVRSWCCQVHFNVRQLQLSLQPLTMTMTMITHTVNSLQQSADLSLGPECLGRGPVPDWRRKNSLDARHIKQGVPPRSLAAWNKVVLHLCWEGAAFRSGRVCREKSCLLLFQRVSLPSLPWFCVGCEGRALANWSSIVSDSQSFNTMIGMDEGASFISNATSPFDSLKWKTAGGSH